MTNTWIRSTGLALLGLTCLIGCNNPVGAVGAKVRENGTVYGPASQVAIINSGAFNYRTLARSDEKAAANARVVFLRGGSPVASAVADGSGVFAVDVPAGIYYVTTTLKLKDGSDATHTGIAIVGASGGTATLDAANACVAAKLQAQGAKARNMDASKLQMALDQMSNAISGLASVPDTTSDSAATAAYDANASADCKSTVQALVSVSVSL